MENNIKHLLRRLISEREEKKEARKKTREKFFTEFKKCPLKSKFISDLVELLDTCSKVQGYDQQKVFNFQSEVEICLTNVFNSLEFDFKKPPNFKKVHNINTGKKSAKKIYFFYTYF